MTLKQDWKEALSEIVGINHVIDDPELYGPYIDDFTDHYKSAPLAVVRPATTEEVSKIIAWCAEHKVPVVTQGGNTGLTGAASTSEADAEIVLSMRRLKGLIAADPANNTISVYAGTTLAEVQQYAEDCGRLFPLSFAAEGNATIGGCAACNAGGVAVLRYGTTREMVLGIEAVLPDGRIWNGMQSLRKDNTGYDLKDLLIGSEGTLGVITALVLKLQPKPQEKETAFACVESPAKAVELLNLAQGMAASALTAFELISAAPISRVVKNLPDIPVPPLGDTPWVVLMELSFDLKPEGSPIEAILESAFENEIVTDAVIAQSQTQQKEFWHVRESIPLADRTEGGSIHSDVSLPISKIPEFLEVTSAKITAAFPWIGESVYGHLGDGNLHYNFVSSSDPTLTYTHEEGIRDILYGEVSAFEGSISAEHGIGQLKLEHNYALKSAIDFELMQRIKDAFDPLGIMNPGKMLRKR